ncbi:CHASE domain-containing protein [Magnetococcus sp. PR-3]|uniref:CHASE domain-containing protein n=1 Tax=Magnetococcus sp. PR-3 TaxID=3120355 RepID=UPI002FCE09DB
MFALSLGQTLQVLLATYLVHRGVGKNSAVIEVDHLIRFTWAVSVAALAMVPLTVGVLWGYDLVEVAQLPMVLLHATVGQILGGLIVTPVVLSFWGKPAQVWQPRRYTVAIPLVCASLLMVVLYQRVVEWDKTRVKLEFQIQSEHLAHALEVNIQGYLDFVHAIERLYASSDYVSHQEFKAFTSHALLAFPGIQALEWVPEVPHAERQAYEEAAQVQGMHDFMIRARNAEGKMVKAPTSDIYYPVYYALPYEMNKTALGFDLGSSPVRRQALEKARDTGKMVASARIQLVQDKGSQSGFLVFYPVYQKGVEPTREETRQVTLRGFALGVFRIGDMLEKGFRDLPREGVEFRLIDLSAKPAQQELYQTPNFQTVVSDSELQWSFPYSVGGRSWKIQFAGSQHYQDLFSSSYPQLTLLSGLFTVTLLGLFLLLLTSRNVRIEQLVEERTAQLKDSESRLSAIFQTAVEAIITIDEMGHIESANAAVSTLFGYTEEEMIGQNVKMLMPAPHRESHDGYLHNYRTTGDAKIIGSVREVEGLTKAGELIPLELSVSDVPMANRRIFTGILHDIRERKRSEKLKNEFVSTVSHELRTPLTSIQGSLGLIKGGVAGELPLKAASLISVAHRNCERLVRLINDILDVEKMEAGKMAFKMEQQAISPLIYQAVETNRGYGEKHEVELKLVEDMPEAIGVVDSDRFAQVMANLISNAVKFSPPQGQVEVMLSSHKSNWLIQVVDHGIGIPDAFKPHIFDKFSQADSGDTRQQGGTGLGLAICKLIVERMGGVLNFESEEGKGTSFFFTLPKHNQVSDLPPELDQASAGARILVCEDDRDIGRVLAMLLANEGYQVDVAQTAAEAKVLLLQHTFSALTLDLMLPDQHGLSLLQELRKDPRWEHLPVIVVSAWVDQAHQALDGSALEVVDWLNKPIDEKRLMHAIEQARYKNREKVTILHVEDDPALRQVVEVMLEPLAHMVGVGSLSEAKEALSSKKYDLVLLDMTLPDGQGTDLLPMLQKGAESIPVVVFSGEDLQQDMSQQISAALVKSRTSNDTLVRTIEQVVGQAIKPTTTQGEAEDG